MNIRKFATITVLVLSSFAASNVAPTKAELEAMYDKAFREFNTNNFPQALKELDAIDARQPDLAESQNLRGVILMRQAQYDQAEVALQKALAIDPKFWNARFNLAEIPFLRKDWGEARKRFDALLQGDAAELQGEAAQLIQYKILLTYLLQGNDNMVDSILAKFELSPDTPAANYSRAAIALHHKNEKEANDLLATAEKNFSPQLNKLFAESIYEVGWRQKPVGQSRAALELTSAADKAAKSKALAADKYEEAEQALQQLDLTAARKLVDEADAADPNQATIINLRGEILLAQKDFDGAEAAFKRALKITPKLSEAHYNLAQIPFKKKEYGKARDRFEALFNATPASGGDKNQTSQIIKFKIYLTLLLEGKDSRAQKMMEQFKFTGDTPALYYAQAAWEFKHDNTTKANLWIVSARKIYSPALNLVFSDSFYDLGWLQRQVAAPAASTELAKADAPPIEPSPIPATALTADGTAKQPADVAAVTSTPPVVSTETAKDTVPSATDALVAKNDTALAAADSSPKADAPVVSNALPSESSAPIPAIAPAVKPAEIAPQTQATKAPDAAAKPATKSTKPVAATNKAPTPATVLAPKTVREWSRPSFVERLDRMTNSHTLFVGALLLAGVLLLASVVISELRRRVHGSGYRSPSPEVPTPAMAPRFGGIERAATPAPVPVRLAGGPPQISLQLKASEPSVRRAAVPFGKVNRPFGAGGPLPSAGNGTTAERPDSPETARVHEPESFSPALLQPVVESAVRTDANVARDYVHTPAPISEVPALAAAPDWEFTPANKGTVAPGDESAAPIPQEPAFHSEALTVFDPPGAGENLVVLDEPPALELPGIPEATVGLNVAAAPVETLVEPMETVGEPVEAVVEPVEAVSESVETVGEPVEAVSEPVETVGEPVETVGEPVEAVSEPVETFGEPMETVGELVEAVAEPVETVGERVEEAVSEPTETVAESVEPVEAVAETEEIIDEPPVEALDELAMEGLGAEPSTVEEPSSVEAVREPIAIPTESVTEPTVVRAPEVSYPEPEPVAQGQPIPYQVPAFSSESAMAEFFKTEPESLPTDLPLGETADQGGFRASVEFPPFQPQVISTEPLAQQPTTPAIMPQPIQPTPVPIRTAPVTGAAPQSASGMQTAVQLTFSFEIASLQLTPSFKMGTLQLKPTSKIVTMRLAPSQQPQPAMNLQVTFEVSSVQLAGNSIGIIRLVPSQQQRPGVINTPTFNIAGLALLSGADSSVQLTPSQQGQASVHVTGRFQISTVEFSPSFEIASIVLNSTSKNVSVQLPGAGPSAVEGAPVFEIQNVQLAGNGDIGMMQLTAQGLAPKPA